MTTPALNQLTATQAAALLSRREITAEALVRACLDRIDQRESQIHAFAHLEADGAIAQARALDAGPVRGLLHGLPLGVKDLMDSADMPTTYGSTIFAGYRPAFDAAATALCKEAGAVVMGKTVSTEFAYFQPGPTRNPHNTAHTPGGSSSGSAASVADHMLPLALGTQTAGSIIRPASYCGVVGYKPSLGRVPGAGVKSLSPTMDVIGGFGRSVADVGLLGAVLTSDERLAHLGDASAPRVGWFKSPIWTQADADTQAMWHTAQRTLSTHAASSEDVAEPQDFGDLIPLQKSVMAFEMARALSHERAHFAPRMSERLNALMAEGMAIHGDTHAAGLLQTLAWRGRMDALFDRYDVLITPSATGEAPAGLGATGDPMFCRSWSLLGLPCVHLPVAQSQHGLPIGLQLVGRHGQDHQLLAVAQWVHERLTR